ncbi:hypothetical protein [Desulfitibacter alkalitolerans]|uniref:hypothetical protein n=1 Tax=Desulfitibacter alkalitolerans TaxID=264641 RepID=UPI0004866159|nr:hypothetical protein [Desulfitibacter alkalitolerans]
MDQEICKDFQETVAQFTIRHKSILDIISKTDEASAKVNRATIKAVTQCGCIEIEAKKHQWPEDINILDIKNMLDSDLAGQLCPDCQDVIETEIGKLLFYITALCNTLNLNLDEILVKENAKILTLGKFNFR